MTDERVHLLAAPLFDPGAGRIELTLPAGLSLAEMIDLSLPALEETERARLRVALVTPGGAQIIPRELWKRVRPRPGVQIVIRVTPGKGAMRSVLMIAVTVAAIAMGGIWGPALAGTLGVSTQVGVALVTAGANIVGSLLANALVPPPQPDDEKRRDRFTISGWRNRYDPDGAVPVVLGTHRYAPPFAATSYTEIVGDWQYVRAAFTFGYGGLELSDFRLGETSLAEYDEVQIEVRGGVAGDAPVTLYPRQVIEETIGAELTRPMPRDDAGNIIDDNASIETPVVRTTADDAERVSIILAWPAGLIYVDDDGDKRTEEVRIRIEQRRVDQTAWTLVETLTVRARKAEAFYRQHSWALPARGRWQVRLTMLTEEPANMGRSRRTVWIALQSLRPEYPFNMAGQALAVLRVKATHQLSGQLDSFSAVARRVCLDYDAPTRSWVTRATSNPASLYRYVLQSPANPRRVGNAQIDLAQLEDWHDFCRTKGLRYDRVLDDPAMQLRDALAEIAAAGRATPRHDGMRWGVTIDRPQALVVDHLTPRNSWGFKATRSYVRPPDAFRVRFNDAGADYAPRERLVRWPGQTGEIVLTEALDLPGKTDAAEVWREARRRQLEAIHRPEMFEASQEGPVRVATRGDQIAINHDVLNGVQRAARVTGVRGREIQLDELVTVVAGTDHAIRFRGLSAEDTVGASMVRPVTAAPGETRLLTVEGDGSLPSVGDLVLFGRAGYESHAAVVTGIEMGEDMTCLVRAVPAAPEIDATLDATAIPAWSSRVGAELATTAIQPPEPRFDGVASGAAGTGTRQLVDIALVPGRGPVPTARYALRHRVAGAASWNTTYAPVADGGFQLSTYTTGTAVEMQAAALSLDGVIGPWTPVLQLTVGGADAGLPEALAEADVTAVPLLGGVRLDFETPADPNITAVRVYRSRSPALDRAADRAGTVEIGPSRQGSLTLGDATRRNMIAAPAMGDASAWSVTGGWEVTGGAAVHTAGSGGRVSQPAALTAGRWYRIGYRVVTISAGSVAASLAGGTLRLGPAETQPGLKLARLQAVTGNSSIGLDAPNDFAGQCDDVIAYQETTTCLEQGTHYLWLEAVNRDGIPGPVTGPIAVTII
ncbi:host specificity factor TipJ family phage tail protein [Paracoccus sanguinis]|uniref:Phage-related protein, tail component n=1 Tax=Paracoccus sanguinis TaxID=1545044 RepID=A0A1H3BNI7_9RHOB|nr:host specificity factor TipJ family phage tail protein [Paracoccus sanguinis]KGJ18727.1 tail protein [Paracoccus sanguinis]SDX42924.1 Phage-related protein, tail component [Paracoccus sanguinis]